MTFCVNGIKQQKGTNTPIELLVVNDSSILVRRLLEKINILILSLQEYKQDPKKFGDVYAKTNRGKEEIQLITNQTDVSKTCMLLLRLGFDLTDINSFSKPLDTAAVKDMLDTTRKDIQKEQEDRKHLDQVKSEQEQKVYTNRRLMVAKEVIAWIFEKTPIVLDSMKGKLTMQELKKISSLQEELRKLRMGNNYEKIRDVGKDLIAVIQDIDEKHFLDLRSQAKILIKDSEVTDIDLEKEETKESYILQLKKLGAHISIKNEDYALLGDAAVFWKFFQKDVINVFIHPERLLYHLYDIIELTVIAILVLAGIFLVYNLLFFYMENISGTYYRMMKFGALGLILFVGNLLKRKDIGNLILIYGGTILLYRLFTNALIVNFAL